MTFRPTAGGVKSCTVACQGAGGAVSSAVAGAAAPVNASTSTPSTTASCRASCRRGGNSAGASPTSGEPVQTRCPVVHTSIHPQHRARACEDVPIQRRRQRHRHHEPSSSTATTPAACIPARRWCSRLQRRPPTRRVLLLPTAGISGPTAARDSAGEFRHPSQPAERALCADQVTFAYPGPAFRTCHSATAVDVDPKPRGQASSWPTSAPTRTADRRSTCSATTRTAASRATSNFPDLANRNGLCRARPCGRRAPRDLLGDGFAATLGG